MGRINFVRPTKMMGNFHRNYSYDYHQVAKVYNNRNGNQYSRYNETSSTIQTLLLSKCLAENRRLRVIGSKWSLSEIPYSKDYTADISSLNLTLPLSEPDRHVNNNASINDFYFFQAGRKIKSISQYLARYKKSLSTSGASNGQSISGAISTGVHGSTIDFGSIQDMVVGLHIIIDIDEMIYLERESEPILSDSFAQKINSKVVRDDNLFNAALVSLGSMGFIYGVAIRAKDNYLLDRHIIPVSEAKALDIILKDNYSHLSSETGNKDRPFHYKLYVNPYSRSGDVVVEVMYKKLFGPYHSPLKSMKESYFGDVPKLLGKLRKLNKNLVKHLANLLENTVFPDPSEPVITGTLADIFYDTGTRGSVFGLAIGTSVNNVQLVLNYLKTIITKYSIPGMIAVRIVKGTQATIGFTRFPQTVIVEIDGVQYKEFNKHLELICNSLQNSKLDFTLHWGKNANWKPELVKYMYGSPGKSYLKDWNKARRKLLSREMRGIFSSEFVEKNLGLNQDGMA